MKQIQIGQKNHNIAAYIGKAFVAYLKKKYPDNEDFEKLNS